MRFLADMSAIFAWCDGCAGMVMTPSICEINDFTDFQTAKSSRKQFLKVETC